MGFKKCVIIETQNLEKKLIIPCAVSDTISSIQRIIRDKLQVPISMQSLYHSRCVLDQQTVLKPLFRESRVVTLSLDILGKGGAQNVGSASMCKPFELKDMTTPDCFEVRRFSIDGPLYHTISKGINFIARCVENDCSTSMGNEIVAIQKGMFDHTKGCCNVRFEAFRLVCSNCRHKIKAKNLENFAFVDCEIKIEWMLEDESEGVVELKAEGEYYVTIKSNRDYRLYEYLIITVS